MNKIEFKKQPLFAMGDIHGHFDILLEFIIKNGFKDCCIIVAGDIGMGFMKKEEYIKLFNSFNPIFEKYGITLLFVRGNHDDPKYFNNDILSFSNIKFVKDYTVIKIGNENILCIGGAISIDRKRRIAKMMCEKSLLIFNHKGDLTVEEANNLITQRYWKDEIPIFDKDAIEEIDENIDYVVTHTSPSFCFKQSRESIESWIENDDKLNNDLDAERKTLDDIYNALIKKFNIKKWIYGHFHEHHNEKINNIEFITLDKDRDNVIDCIEVNHI